MKPSYLIILLVMNFFWRAVYSAYKLLGQALPTGAIVTLRFGLAGLILLIAWHWLPGPAPRGRDLVRLRTHPHCGVEVPVRLKIHQPVTESYCVVETRG